jgi:hypothetical protein
MSTGRLPICMVVGSNDTALIGSGQLLEPEIVDVRAGGTLSTRTLDVRRAYPLPDRMRSASSPGKTGNSSRRVVVAAR